MSNTRPNGSILRCQGVTQGALNPRILVVDNIRDILDQIVELPETEPGMLGRLITARMGQL